MKLTIGKKLGLSTFLFSLAALVPFVILGIMAVSTARESFIEDRFAQLESVRGIKKAQIEKFFAERKGDLGVLVENVRNLREGAFDKLKVVQSIKKHQIEGYFQERMADVSVLSANDTVASAMESFAQAFKNENRQTGGELWKAVEESYEPWMKHYQKEYGYHDLVLICQNGDVVYSVAKESDLGQNVVTGELKDSPLGSCFRKAMKGAAIQDFEPYAPSNHRHAAFIGAPVKNRDDTLGVVALRLPTAPINAIVQDRAGMGKTGETYLIAEEEGRITFQTC